MGKFVIRKSDAGVKFDLKAGNGEIIASSELYAAEASCLNGVESVRKCCAGPVEDLCAEAALHEKNPKFEVYQDRQGQYRFRLKARNGQIIANSESYKTKTSCLNGVKSVKKNAPDARIVRM